MWLQSQSYSVPRLRGPATPPICASSHLSSLFSRRAFFSLFAISLLCLSPAWEEREKVSLGSKSKRKQRNPLRHLCACKRKVTFDAFHLDACPNVGKSQKARAKETHKKAEKAFQHPHSAGHPSQERPDERHQAPERKTVMTLFIVLNSILEV